MMLTMYDFILLSLFLFVVIHFYYKHKFNYWKKRGVPFRKPLPFVGNLLDMVLSNPFSKFFTDLYYTDGRYYGFYSLTRPYLLIKDIDLIRRILIKDFHSFANRTFHIDEKIDPFICYSLPGIQVNRWKSLRKQLTPVFTSGKMKAMTYLIVECGKQLEEYLSTKSGGDLEMKEVAAKYTINVISSCAFGLNGNTFTENSDFLFYGQQLFPTTLFYAFKTASYIFAPFFVKVFRFTFVNNTAVQFFYKVFKKELERREISKTKRNDLVDILNEIKNQETSDDTIKFEGDQIYAQAVVFFGAGQEATSSTIAFTLHELSVKPDIQHRLREEINKVIEAHGGITYEAIQDMKYLHMVVSETLRKYPATPILHRECTENYLVHETGLVIEKGTPLIIFQMCLHLDSKYFPDPTKYNPERFSDENKHEIPKYAYLPFGDGPRNCIGERFALLSVKLGIIHFLKKFEVMKNSNTRDPIDFTRSLNLRSKYGVHLTCKKLEA
ncbi:hypothetical protein FQA39_LY07994 [Lamprigera yunnana]|nr:hypothetical protein FQA39_LY07994 [Lamprigera yunnana]